MKILYPTGTVTQFYGRNALMYVKGWQSPTTAPHLQTWRVQYTVPAGKRAVLTGVYLFMRRVTIAAPVGIAQMRLESVTADGTRYIANLYLFTNVVNDYKDLIIPIQIFLTANDQINLMSIDTSTGGTIDYSSAIPIVEFTP